MADPRQQDQTFKGLVLAANGGELPPGASPVFHNCDISADGSVIRRPGSNLVYNLEGGNIGGAWSQVVKTKRGTEYIVVVTQTRITIILCIEFGGTAFSQVILVKNNVWKRTLTDVNFVTLAAPYDRLLILTGNHPPVQLSFLERAASFTCTSLTLQTLTSPTVASDSKMWRDTNINGNFIFDPVTQQYHTVSAKGAYFSVTVPTVGMALNEVRALVLTQVSWQWWAESTIWKGKDVSQAATRFNVNAVDQNVKIPADIITDLDPRYNNTSGYRGIFLATNNNWLVSGGVANPSVFPSTSAAWAHGAGQRYIPSASVEPQHSPFFATFGTLEATGTQSLAQFYRVRELRFNAGTGLLPNDLDVYLDGVLKTNRLAYSVAANPGDAMLYTDTYTATDRNPANTPNLTTKATGVALFADSKAPSFQGEFILSNRENKWMASSGKSTYYLDLPVGGGEIDGTYVPALGLGQFSDYLNGSFPAFGAIFRDRLVLKTPNESVDQVLLSATSDTLSPGAFYAHFQITDALTGTIDDPFTVNITAKSRERITCLLGWQQSLFVFTSVSTYSITGGELFGPDSYTTGLVASYGAFNSRCVLATNLTILFLNRYGLFDLLNKNNTSDYGSFERSEPIRPIFADNLIASTKDALPWLALNDSTNKVYMGLPASTDGIFCSYIYALNLAWNSWSSISSAAPLNAYIGLQLLTWTMFVTRVQTDNTVVLLQMDARHNLDFVINTAGATVGTVTYPSQRFTPLVDTNGIVDILTPSAPFLREYSLIGTSAKIGSVYTSTTSLSVITSPRNWMFDIPELHSLLGGSVDTGSVYVMRSTGEPYALYPRLTSLATSTITLQAPLSVSGVTYTTSQVLGTIYPSIFATSFFFAQSMGKLKRLKNLNLLFDNSISRQTQYYSYPFKQQNSVIALIVSDTPGGDILVDAQMIADYIRLDAQRFDFHRSVDPRRAISIPLLGYTCDYQLMLCSTGGDAFKLTGYEFDVQVQRTRNSPGEG